MANIIPSGTTAANSGDLVVAAGAPITVFLNDADGRTLAEDANALVQIKAASGQYMTVGMLSRSQPALIIDGPGTYRVSKRASAVAVAVDQS